MWLTNSDLLAADTILFSAKNPALIDDFHPTFHKRNIILDKNKPITFYSNGNQQLT